MVGKRESRGELCALMLTESRSGSVFAFTFVMRAVREDPVLLWYPLF